MKSAPAGILTFLGSLLLAGCIMLPTPEHGLLYGRAALREAELPVLKAGNSTREDVLLRLGEPDLVLASGEAFVYSWAGIGGYAFGGGGLGVIPMQHVMLIRFSREGMMQGLESTGSRLAAFFGEDRLAKANSPPLAVIVDPLPGIWTRFETAAPEAAAARVKLGEFRDERAVSHSGTLIGWKRLANFGLTEVHTSHPPHEIVQAAVAQHVRRAGLLLVETDEDWTISGAVTHFEQGGLSQLTRLDVTLALYSPTGGSPVSRRYRSSHFSLNDDPQQFAFERGFGVVLEDFQHQLASDTTLRRLLSATP